MPPKSKKAQTAKLPDLHSIQKMLDQLDPEFADYYPDSEKTKQWDEEEKKEYQRLFPKISQLEATFEQLYAFVMTPNQPYYLAEECLENARMVAARIGTFYGKNNLIKASEYLTKALFLGHFSAGLYLLSLEQRLGRVDLYVFTLENLLNTAAKPEFLQAAKEYKKNLCAAAEWRLMIFEMNLQGAGQELKHFIKNNIRYLGKKAYFLMIDIFIFEENLGEALEWFKKLCIFNNITKADLSIDIDGYISKIFSFCFNQKKYHQCIEILQNNQKYLSALVLGHCSTLFFDLPEPLSDEFILKQAYLWWVQALLQAPVSEEKHAAKKLPFGKYEILYMIYFSKCFSKLEYKHIFQLDKTIEILQLGMQCSLEKIKGKAFYHFGYLYESGYETIEENYPLALKYFHQAAAFKHTEAFIKLCDIYWFGLCGESVDKAKAKSYCEVAMQSAGIEGIDATIKMASFLFEDANNNAAKMGIQLLTKAETALKPFIEHPATNPLVIDEFSSKICLLRAKLGLTYAVGNYSLAATIKDLERATASKTLYISCLAYLELGRFYAQNSERKSYKASRKYLKKALDLSIKTERIKEHINAMQLLANNYQEEAKSISNDPKRKKILTDKVHRYLQQMMELTGISFKLWDIFDKSPRDQMRSLLQNIEKKGWKEELKHLKKMLANPSSLHSLEALEEITKSIINIDERFLDDTSIFPKLTQVVQSFVSSQRLGTNELLYVFELIGRWHLVDASAELVGLFEQFQPQFWTFSVYTRAFNAFAHAGLQKEAQEKYVIPIIEKALADPNLFMTASIFEKIQCLHALALLDSNKPSKASSELAHRIFMQLEDFSSAGYCDISPFYHAHRYFSLRYKELDWSLTEIQSNMIEEHAKMVVKNPPEPSKKQKEIFQVFKKLSSTPEKMKQEVLEPELLRYVDFEVEGRYVQYHGTIHHYFYDNQGKAKIKALPTVLSDTMYALLGKKAFIIGRNAWDKLEEDEEGQKRLWQQICSKKTSTLPSIAKSPFHFHLRESKAEERKTKPFEINSEDEDEELSSEEGFSVF